MKTTKPTVTHTNIWEGKLYRFDLFKTDTFETIQNANQVYGLIIDREGKLLTVAGKTKIWILPGGTVERGEDYLNTLNREIYEEAAVRLDQSTIKPVFYQKIFSKTKTGWQYLSTGVRYLAKVAKKEVFTKDPDGHVKFQKWVEIDKLDEFIKWGKTTEFIKELIL